MCIGPYDFKKNIILFFKIDVKIKLLVILIVIMGVAYYYSWIIKNHKNIINKLENVIDVDNLYLDSNSIIYDAIDFNNFSNRNQFEKYLIQNVIDKIEDIIKIVNPNKNIIIAFDGVPPLAKLNQQKNRRYKSSFQNKLFNKNPPWDTTAITPGSLFMDKLNTTIKSHFNKKYIDKNVILSLSDEPGEGEHKLFEFIRNNDHKNDICIIYGLDADLIHLSLNHLKYTKSIYLYRETPEFISSLDSNLDTDQKYVIDINLLALQTYKYLTDCEFDNKNYDLYYNKISDYIFICFLLGNDFNEHFPVLNLRHNGLTILLDLYRSLFGIDKNLIKDGEIIWKNFKTYIGKLAENEEEFLKNIYVKREKQAFRRYSENTEKEKEIKFVATPTWERNIEKFINPYEEDWQFRYYYSLFDVNVDNDSNAIPKICRNYIETLQWTFYYYSKDCINWTHSYKYHYPPLLQDLYKHIPYFNSELVLKKDKDVIHSLLLLSYVLPKSSLNLLPDNIHNYLLKNYENYYRDDYEFVYSFCKYFWEGHVKFPELDFNRFSSDIMKLI